MSNPPSLSRYLVPNCFEPDAYYQLDVRLGVMKNRFGTKCCTFSAHALRGIYLALKDEVGPAWRIVLRQCGIAWGKKLAERFLKEISSFYGESLDVMTMARFTALVEEYFAVSGWGRLHLDYSRIDRGLLLVTVNNDVMGDLLRDSGERSGPLLEGVLSSLFSATSGTELDCLEIESPGMQGKLSRLVICTPARLRPVPAWLEQGATHDQVIDRLLTATNA